MLWWKSSLNVSEKLRCTIMITDYVLPLDLTLTVPNQLLEYLHIDSKDSHTGETFMDLVSALNVSEKLRCTIVTTDYVLPLDSTLAVPNQLLEYLHIDSKDSHTGETFMDLVSAHDKLKDVTFDTHSITVAGICSYSELHFL